ncbi:hypothetical protein [Hymenobacter fodinae]|uniref:YD repeat-containing protein n=1 Tax=Hymenobacter fodinae TaxID=2510796 RepID=A0A4Z0P5V3_9BACT|nr:hypothetical protein [Hymenobacter fodinae]TGE06037.1 hypothetical protein EU556_14305 [Hymenobacter fodinae]
MRIYLLLISLLLSGLLLPSGSQAQTAEAATPDPSGPIEIEPDSVTRHLYSKARVRSVAKVLINDEGEVEDTVSYQEVDVYGRLTLLNRRTTLASLFNQHSSPQLSKQWSYNAMGHCTSLVVHPTPTPPYTLIYTYNPKLGRGKQQVLKPDGTTITMSELSLRQHADTLITEKATHAIFTQGVIYKQESQHRTLRYMPHPDTILLVHYRYNEKGKLQKASVNYSLSHEGRVLEMGILDLIQATKRHALPQGAAGHAALHVYSQALWALRHRQGVYPKVIWSYDSQNRVVQQQIRTLDVKFVNNLTSSVKHTYNSQHQLIASEQNYLGFGQSYTLYSYSPIGLLIGETSNARSGKPMFYRYLYQFHE